MSVIFALLSHISDQMPIEVVGRIIVATQNMEGVAVDLHVSSNSHVSWSDEGTVVVNVLVPVAVKELALDDARVLLGGLVDGDAVISQVEGDDEAAVNIFWDAGVETSCEPEDLFVIVNTLEEVALGLIWDELVDVAKRVLLVAEPVVWWDLGCDCLRWSWEFNASEWPVVSVLLGIERLG